VLCDLSLFELRPLPGFGKDFRRFESANRTLGLYVSSLPQHENIEECLAVHRSGSFIFFVTIESFIL